MSKVIPIGSHVNLGDLYLQGQELYKVGGMPGGQSTGWTGLDEFYTVQTGQWTVVTGVPGSGKSEWLDALMVNLAEADPTWLFSIYSPENHPQVTHLVKLVEKRMRKPFSAGPTPRMSLSEYNDGAAWVLSNFLWLSTDLATPETLLETARLYGARGRRRGIVLDPWNTLEHERGGQAV